MTGALVLVALAIAGAVGGALLLVVALNLLMRTPIADDGCDTPDHCRWMRSPNAARDYCATCHRWRDR